MKPILFDIFGISIKSYGLMISIGVIVAVEIFCNKASKRGYDENNVLDVFIYAILGGALGGKLLWIITEFKEVLKQPIDIFRNFQYGFVIYGAIIGGSLGIYIACKKSKIKCLDIFDIAVPCVALAQGFGRIGCFLAGCCYGAPTSSPLGVEFNNSPFAPTNIRVHPTQLYSSAFDFLLGIFLLCYLKKEHKSGQVFAMYIIIYSIGRFIIEFLRDDPRGTVGMLSTSQFIAIFTLIFGIFIFNIYKRKNIKKN